MLVTGCKFRSWQWSNESKFACQTNCDTLFNNYCQKLMISTLESLCWIFDKQAPSIKCTQNEIQISYFHKCVSVLKKIKMNDTVCIFGRLSHLVHYVGHLR